MATRTRNMFTLKKSLSRQLPGKPPVRAFQLVYQGTILDDEMLVDELFDEDDEDDDEEIEDGSSTAADDTLTTEELLQAYFLNQVAMTQNAMLLGNPDHAMSSTFRLEMREQAQQLLDQFREQTPPDVWSASLETKDNKGVVEERRGHRYRTSAGGIHSSVRKTIQTNLNIARPVKLWTKTLFYMMTNPPPVVSSLLPAPQQVILNIDLDEAYETLYGKKVVTEGEDQEEVDDEEDDSDVDDEE
eukprot:Nitzschia sp. Nitz4//scaffold12_size214221//201143//202157//NITZ4_001538-RA/size214221-exonerate_protein2genome-gene-0.59-mRNA-1//1//CDS//3329535134//3768//frame0